MKFSIVKTSIGHDSMTISAKFLSGASFKYTINRDGDKIEFAFSNDTNVLVKQGVIIQLYIAKLRKNSADNTAVFYTLEILLKSCGSGAEVIACMKLYNLEK